MQFIDRRFCRLASSNTQNSIPLLPQGRTTFGDGGVSSFKKQVEVGALEHLGRVLGEVEIYNASTNFPTYRNHLLSKKLPSKKVLRSAEKRFMASHPNLFNWWEPRLHSLDGVCYCEPSRTNVNKRSLVYKVLFHRSDGYWFSHNFGYRKRLIWSRWRFQRGKNPLVYAKPPPHSIRTDRSYASLAPPREFLGLRMCFAMANAFVTFLLT